MGKCKCVLLAVVLLAAFAGVPRVQGQWLAIKGAIQEEVKIIEETEARIVLFHPTENVLLVLTTSKQPDSDIFGALEVRRGGNPYRVWITTKQYEQKLSERRNSATLFFQEGFVHNLQTEDTPINEAPLPEATPELTSSDSSSRPWEELNSLRAAVMETVKTVFAVAESLRAPEPEKFLSPALLTPLPEIDSRIKTKRNAAHTAETGAGAELPQTSRPLASHQSSPAPVSINAEPSPIRVDSLVAEKQIDSTLADADSKQAPETQRAEPPAKVAWPRLGRTAFMMLYLLGVLMALLGLVMLALIAFSARFRARICIWRDDYDTAVRIYERELERHPQKIKLNSALADLYLLLGRHDDMAMHVYKTVLRLNLKTAYREKINGIVAQQLLAEGRTDADAIEILEKELNSELLRKNKTEKK